MPYRFLDDIATADVAFRATGATREELFAACAEALLNVLVDNPDAVTPHDELVIDLENAELDLLLFAFLQELVFYKDARRLLLHPRTLTVSETNSGFSLQAVVAGERIDPLRHHLGVDVKAVTLHRFQVRQTAAGWEATIILDV
ncbi:MAG TPA: archease [Geobacteraceae bacterium]